MYEIKQNTATVEYQPHFFFIGQTADKIPSFLLQQKIAIPIHTLLNELIVWRQTTTQHETKKLRTISLEMPIWYKFGILFFWAP